MQVKVWDGQEFSEFDPKQTKLIGVNSYLVFEQEEEHVIVIDGTGCNLEMSLSFLAHYHLGLVREFLLGGGEVRSAQKYSRANKQISNYCWLSGKSMELPDNLHNQVGNLLSGGEFWVSK